MLFTGNTKAKNYQEIVANFLSSYKELGCSMTIKIHFLESHLEFFPDNLGQLSDEQGERAHQDLKRLEQRYDGKHLKSGMADYCWSLYRTGHVGFIEGKTKRQYFSK